ncbi:hypothetical protein [Pseudoalteromonas sp. JC3]|uniref:hypothetical protein n=1 Tax=Pseudoalteromonas sp. JC3 TaxID=2810196 RepID=UPI0019D0CB5A|nr:hypothetical protein [Pseudoalteromonas sp. JC3]MBR8843041.1 hypothetical protein [Pseudoalteromonas sp. JC3]WJE10735.1 hypothetical protein QSH61_21855 [Pseudoalteromonas sp. JC3]
MKLEAALIGLVGVIIGAILATMKDWWFHRAKEKRRPDLLSHSGQLLIGTFYFRMP